ncbi:MAG: hypothetical protein WB439_00620 [Acidobacteriaceae bacterium]
MSSTNRSGYGFATGHLDNIQTIRYVDYKLIGVDMTIAEDQ